MMGVWVLFKLIQNEWVKYFNRPSTYIMFGFIILLFIGLFALNSIFKPSLDQHKSYSSNDYKTEVKADLEKYEKELNTLNEKRAKRSENEFNIEEEMKAYEIEAEISRLSFYLKEDTPPPAINDFFTQLWSGTSLIQLVAIIMAVFSSGLMSREHQQGTIKLLLIRPASRIKIFFSKWIIALITSVIFVLFIYLCSAIVGLITGTMNPTRKYAVMSGENLTYKMVDFWPFFMKLVASDILFVIIIASIAYVLSVITRNTSAALGLSLGILFFGGLVTGYISSKTDLGKFLWPANWNLNQYINPTLNPPVEKMTLGFSLTYDIIVLIVILLLTAWLFKKRDVAN